jgi:hypothetical protein
LTLFFNLELEISPPWGPQPTQKNINTEQTKKFAHNPSGNRTHDPRFGAAEDSTRQGEEIREKSAQCLTMEALSGKVLPS